MVFSICQINSSSFSFRCLNTLMQKGALTVWPGGKNSWWTVPFWLKKEINMDLMLLMTCLVFFGQGKLKLFCWLDSCFVMGIQVLSPVMTSEIRPEPLAEFFLRYEQMSNHCYFWVESRHEFWCNVSHFKSSVRTINTLTSKWFIVDLVGNLTHLMILVFNWLTSVQCLAQPIFCTPQT